MPHIDGNEQDLVERKKYRDLQENWQTTRHRIDFLVLVKRHELLLLLGAIVLEPLPDLLHLRLQLLHLRHRLVALVGERKERELDEHGGGKNGEAVIAEQLGAPVQQLEERLGNEIEPAPIDQQVELLGAELLLIGFDQRHLLGTSKQIAARGGRRAGCDSDGVQQQIGLKPIFASFDATERSRIGDLLVGN